MAIVRPDTKRDQKPGQACATKPTVQPHNFKSSVHVRRTLYLRLQLIDDEFDSVGANNSHLFRRLYPLVCIFVLAFII